MDPGPTHPKVILPCARVPAFLALAAELKQTMRQLKDKEEDL